MDIGDRCSTVNLRPTDLRVPVTAVRLIEPFIDTANIKSSLLLQQEMVYFRNNRLLEPDSFRKWIRNFSSNSLKRLSRGYETLWLRIRSMAVCDNRYQALNEEYDAVGHWTLDSGTQGRTSTFFFSVTQPNIDMSPNVTKSIDNQSSILSLTTLGFQINIINDNIGRMSND